MDSRKDSVMSKREKLTGGQAHEIVGWANRLTSEEYQKRRGVLKLLTNPDFPLDAIKVVKHVINCDADPFIPDGWDVKSHKKGGELEWDPQRIKLHLDEGQKDGRVIVGSDLRKKLADQPTLNANVLDYLLAHPELIPESWKDEHTPFWGTIYYDSVGNVVVRYLYWSDLGWDWGRRLLGYDWDSNYPAAILAS